MSYDALFSPIKLRGLELKNRVVLPGMNTKMVKNKHDVGEDLPAYHAARAAGGCGLNIVELVSICPECHAYLYLGLYNEHHRDQLRKITDAIHAAGGKAGVQIWHGGFVPEEFFDKTNKLETPDTLTVASTRSSSSSATPPSSLARPALTRSSSTARTPTCRTNS